MAGRIVHLYLGVNVSSSASDSRTLRGQPLYVASSKLRVPCSPTTSLSTPVCPRCLQWYGRRIVEIIARLHSRAILFAGARHIAARPRIACQLNLHPAFLELARQYRLGDQINVLIEAAIPFDQKHLAPRRESAHASRRLQACSYNEDATANLQMQRASLAPTTGI